MSIQYGDWKVIKIIGSGAFGTVYEIRRETLGFVQTAALKVISIPQSQRDADALRSTGMDEASIGEYYKELAAQLMNELRTMEQLKGHTNIVSYEDHEIRKKENGFGWDLYIRMELLTPLSKYMLAHNMEREEIIRLGIDLCRALERCESLNIIHRDIKPDNIFISKMGDGKLGDFGIARTVERTMSGLSQKGTYGYMAPEIYLGQPYGKTVDIYSLGLVLYKLLNYNRGPFLPAYPNPIRFQDQEQALVRRIRGEQLPAPVQADRRLAEVVLKACSADPGLRYATAGEMGRALLAVAENKEQESTPADNRVSDESEYSRYDDRRTVRLIYPAAGPESILQPFTEEEKERESREDSTITVIGEQKAEKQAEISDAEKSETLKGLETNPVDVDGRREPQSENKKKRWLLPGIAVVAVVIGIAAMSPLMRANSVGGKQTVKETEESSSSEQTVQNVEEDTQFGTSKVSVNVETVHLYYEESTTIYITAEGMESVHDLADPNWFEIEMGELEGDTLPVTIKLIREGNSLRMIEFSAYGKDEYLGSVKVRVHCHFD